VTGIEEGAAVEDIRKVIVGGETSKLAVGE